MIQLAGVGLALGGPAKRGSTHILRDLSFQLDRGEFAWLTGARGAGKSTLLRILDTTLAPTAGSARVLGRDPRRGRRRHLAGLRRRIGRVHDTPHLFDHLTAFENVALKLRLDGTRPGAAVVDATEMLQWVGLGDRMHVPGYALSRGEAQLCAIARAVVARPALLLADEPFAHLTETETSRMFALFREMGRLGATVLLATRDDRLPASFPAAMIRLDRGCLASVDEA